MASCDNRRFRKPTTLKDTPYQPRDPAIRQARPINYLVGIVRLCRAYRRCETALPKPPDRSPLFAGFLSTVGARQLHLKRKFLMAPRPAIAKHTLHHG
jgi:hypothetical protein